MSQYTAAVVGTGPEPENPVWGESAAMAYRHGDAYRDLPASDLVACADIVRENAEAFAEEFDIPDERVYEDATAMLQDAEPDVISVCTPVPTHADIVLDAIETGVPRAIHCEKPMADTWGDSKRMTEAAADAGIQLTFNHQRRFGPEWRRASDLLDEGLVGDLSRVEVGGKNFYDYGTHLIDLADHFAGERGAEWVLAQIDYREENVRYGVHNENQGIAVWAYGNGVHGLASTGRGTGADAIGSECRLVGESGVLEVRPHDVDTTLRYRGEDTDGWVEETHEAETPALTLAIEHVMDALSAGEEPELSADKALRATEIIFGAWESARARGRIEFPLQAEGNALTEMVEGGELNPE